MQREGKRWLAGAKLAVSWPGAVRSAIRTTKILAHLALAVGVALLHRLGSESSRAAVAAKAQKRQGAKKRQDIVLAATPLRPGSPIRFAQAPDVSARTRSWRFLAPWRFNFLVGRHQGL
jgi:hypothetical protein